MSALLIHTKDRFSSWGKIITFVPQEQFCALQMKKATTNNHQMIRYPKKNSVFAEEKGAFENISFSLKVNYVIL